MAHVDGSYDVYYIDDGDTASSLKPAHIKRPLDSSRQKDFGNWNKYCGKVFFDEGTKKGEDKKDPDYELEAGEWVVDAVTCDNNFICCRIGRPFREEDNEIFDISYVLRRIRKCEEE